MARTDCNTRLKSENVEMFYKVDWEKWEYQNQKK